MSNFGISRRSPLATYGTLKRRLPGSIPCSLAREPSWQIRAVEGTPWENQPLSRM
ncbi:hypothetical protein JJD41_14725 [Oxynema sp. CENA135]|nr:hypothetical protein [Oxynema sp. CENA135]